jgi:dihydrofolate synthase/folylpolyglutamate synthase
MPNGGKCTAVLAVMEDKKIAGSLRELSPYIDQWYLPELPGIARAMAPAVLARHLLNEGVDSAAVHTVGDVASYLPAIRATLCDRDCLVVFGSFFTVSAVMQAMPATAFVETLH